MITESGYASHALSARQLIILGLTGIALWFVAAMLIRFLAPMGALEGMTRVLTYTLVVPGTLPFIYLIKWVGGLKTGQIALAAALVTGAAALCDGIALAWFPSIYGATVEIHAAAGGVILWGAGVAIMLGFLVNKPAEG